MILENRSDNPRYFLETFGCQMNISDSERIAELLEKKGYIRTNEVYEADLILVNMCSIRKSAVHRVHGLVQKIIQLRKIKPELKSILTGCFLDHPEQKSFLKTFNIVCKIDELFGANAHYLLSKPKNLSSFQAYVPIMTGCNNFCTYCVVPYTRGREYSRPAQEIIKEIKSLIQRGFKEIWLLGQNVNSYQDLSNDPAIDFASLLSKINNLHGDFWLYFTSSHPKDFSDRVIEVMAKSKKIAPYLNLPVQSGDKYILGKMNRSYVPDDYMNEIKKVRDAFRQYRIGLESKIAISTDIIVGFPGENKWRFLKTAYLMRKIGFDMAYISRYSPRPFTMAESLRDNVSNKKKVQREKILNNILKKTALKNNQFYINNILPVLIVEMHKSGKYLIGRSRAHKKVKIKSNHRNLIGRIISVRVINAYSWGLFGDIWSEGLVSTSEQAPLTPLPPIGRSLRSPSRCPLSRLIRQK